MNIIDTRPREVIIRAVTETHKSTTLKSAAKKALTELPLETQTRPGVLDVARAVGKRCRNDTDFKSALLAKLGAEERQLKLLLRALVGWGTDSQQDKDAAPVGDVRRLLDILAQ